MTDEDLKKFLTDPLNDENSPDRKFVIEYLAHTFYLSEFRFLDVGCGTGNQYLSLKQLGIKEGLGFEYLGVDKTSNMVEFARKRFPDGRFVQDDINDLHFPDRSWNVVYCRHVLDHLPGYEKALSELARVCSNCLIICILKQLADKQQINVIGKPPSQTEPNQFSEHYLNTYPRKPFMETLKNLGFDVVVDQLIEVGGFFGNYELIIARRREPDEEQAKAEYEQKMIEGRRGRLE